jgi:hypothetical protein
LLGVSHTPRGCVWFFWQVTKNGQAKLAHVVIKNSPFVVTIGQEVAFGTGARPLDFAEYAVDCTLLYDTDANKMVDYVHNKPVEFKAAPADRGTQLQLELRIKVLTSQHEDMFFRVLVQLFDRATKTPVPDLYVRTMPIKVISKPEQAKKRKRGGAEKETKERPPPSKQRRSQQQQQQPQPTDLAASGSVSSASGSPANQPPILTVVQPPGQLVLPTAQQQQQQPQ